MRDTQLALNTATLTPMVEGDDIRLLQGPPRRQWLGWIAWGIHTIYALVTIPGFTDLMVNLGFVMVAVAFRRVLGRRALWVTRDEIYVSNSEDMHVIPMQGARVKVTRVERGFFGEQGQPDFDNTDYSTLKLFVIPGDGKQQRVAVDAGLGMSPPKLRALAADIERAIAAA